MVIHFNNVLFSSIPYTYSLPERLSIIKTITYHFYKIFIDQRSTAFKK